MKNEPDKNSLQPVQESLNGCSKFKLCHFFNICIYLHFQKNIFSFFIELYPQKLINVTDDKRCYNIFIVVC